MFSKDVVIFILSEILTKFSQNFGKKKVFEALFSLTFSLSLIKTLRI